MVSINKISNVSLAIKPSFKADAPKDKIMQSEQSCKTSGCECLANYNKALTPKLEPCVLSPLEPENVSNIDEIEGEKIYTSEGKLHSIVQDNEDVKKIYLPEEKDEHSVSSIITVDKKSGNKIRAQYVNKENNSISLDEYSPSTGKITKSTIYTDGKLDYTANMLYKPYGETITEDYSSYSKTFMITKDKKNRSQTAIFDKNKQMVEYRDNLQMAGKNINTVVSFYNGGMYKVEKNTEVVLPNNLGREIFVNNQELKPAAKFTPSIDVKGQKGEKTYYSNGAIETNSFEQDGDKVVAKFTPDGKLTEFVNGDKKITYSDNFQRIDEKLDDEHTKSTQIFDSGDARVIIEAKNSYKQLVYDAKTKNPSFYEEGFIDENGRHVNEKMLYFDKKGMLQDAFQN